MLMRRDTVSAVTGPTDSRVGIDFGTTHTVAALSGADGRSQPLLFDASFLLPSAVFAETDGRLLVGRDAERSAKLDPTRFEPNPKRRVDDGNVLLGSREYPVTDLIAAVLRRAGDEAARVSGAMPARAVLTYPAHWAASRKSVLAEAAGRAGLPAVTLVPEPIAAAVYFTTVLGHVVPPGAVLVIYDFGGGTFDTSLLRRRPDQGWEVLVSDGLDDVGGVDLDAAIIDYLRQTLGTRDATLWNRLTEPTDDAARRRHRMLWEEVRAAKEQLSRASSAAIHVPLFDTDVYLTREEFERVARPYLERTVDLTVAAAQRAGVRHDHIAGLFPVGGSSRIPLVSTLLHHRLGVAPTLIEQPELVVALGSVLAAGPQPGRPGAYRPMPTAPVSTGFPISPISGPIGPVSSPPGAASVSPPFGPTSPVSAPAGHATGAGRHAAPPGSPVAGPTSPATSPTSPADVTSTMHTTASAAEPPPSSMYPAPPPLPPTGPGPMWPQGAVAPPPRKSSGGKRVAILAGVVVAVLLLCGIGGVQAWRTVSNAGKSGDSNSGDRGNSGTGNTGNTGNPAAGNTGNAKAGAKTQTVQVNKSAWYSNFKLTFGKLTFDADKSPQLVAEVLMENLAPKDSDPGVDMVFGVDGKQYPGDVQNSTTVAAGQKSTMEFGFDLDRFTGSIAGGVFTIGRGDRAQAVVPVGAGELIAYEPKVLLKDTKVVNRDLTITYKTCSLGGGFFDYHGQANKGYLAFTCFVDVQYTGGSAGGHYYGEEHFRLGLPDGTEIGPTVSPNEALYSANVEPDTYVGFMIKAPAKGTYVLRFVDVHAGEKRSPALVKETPVTL
jgi:hypothetical protein